MTNRFSRLCLVVALVAACGGEDDPLQPLPDATADASEDAATDAPAVSFDVTCRGELLPTTAPSHVRFTGTVTSLVSGAALTNVQVSVAKFATGEVFAGGVTTGADGVYDIGALNLPPGIQTEMMTPLDAYLRASEPNVAYVAQYIFPRQPFAVDDAGRTIAMWTPGLLEAAHTAAGLTRDTSLATLWVQVVDCAGAPVTGAVVSFDVTPGGIAYLDATGTVDPALTATGASGWAMAFNVPAGTPRVVKVAATAEGLSFPVNRVQAWSATMSVTRLHP